MPTMLDLLHECDKRLIELELDGVEQSVARDRTFDAFQCLFSSDESMHTYDKRDRLFERHLRDVYQDLVKD